MKKLIFSALAMVGMAFGANAQDGASDNHNVTIVINEHFILDIEPNASKDITMTFTPPTEAGNALNAPSNNTSLWLNYSSIVSTAETRTITVKSAAAIPAGLEIKVTASATATISGGGTGGTGGTEITLSTSDQTIVSGIGSVYTGTGSGSGNQLTYAVSTLAASYGALVARSPVVNVVYTITNL